MTLFDAAAPIPEIDPIEQLLDDIRTVISSTLDETVQKMLTEALAQYDGSSKATLTNQITFYDITDAALIPNRVPIMFLKNADRTDVYCGWFLTGGNAAGLEEGMYSFYWDLDKAFIFKSAGKLNLQGGVITHWGYPYPRGTTPPPPAVLEAMSGKDLPL